MTRLLQLDCFDGIASEDVRHDLSVQELEEARLQAYETGYAAGWEDAVNAQEDEIARLRADLGQNLRDMALSYGEARAHVLRSLEPLLTEMVAKVLPLMAQEALGHVVLEALRPEAERLAETPAQIRAHPENRHAIEQVVLSQVSFPLVFDPEPLLSHGQVQLVVGPMETSIDLAGVIEQIGLAVHSFFHPEQPQEARNG